jgi:hypothetical protein
LLPFVLWFGGRWVVQKARNQPVSLGFRPAWLWLAVAAVIAFGVVRNVPGFPFAGLPQ